MAYQASKRSCGRNLDKIAQLELKIETTFHEWSEGTTLVSLKAFNTWMRDQNKLMGLLQSFNNEDAVKDLNRKREFLQSMLISLGAKQSTDGKIRGHTNPIVH